MSKIAMPSPAAWMLAAQTMGGNVSWKLSWTQSGVGACHRLSGEPHEKPLITTDQAEAYANAMVREVLEQAAAIIQTAADESDRTIHSLALTEYANDIRALIKQ